MTTHSHGLMRSHQLHQYLCRRGRPRQSKSRRAGAGLDAARAKASSKCFHHDDDEDDDDKSALVGGIDCNDNEDSDSNNSKCGIRGSPCKREAAARAINT